MKKQNELSKMIFEQIQEVEQNLNADMPKGECGESLKVAVTALINAYKVIEQMRLRIEVQMVNTLDQILQAQKNIINKLEDVKLSIPG